MAELGSAGVGESVVTEECLQELLDFFAKSAYRAKTVDRRYEVIHKMCLHLVARDYTVEVIDNKGGQLCGHYPSELIVLEGHQPHLTPSSLPQPKVNDAVKLKELFTTARFARCRSRFVMPVLLFENKNICRSATLSTMAELYGRSGVDWIFTGGEGTGTGVEQEDQSTGAAAGSQASNNDSVLLNRIRGQDVQLLKALQVQLIYDLMVEKKKTKYGVIVCSSEKVDKWARYADFLIASVPYPGCEFFKDYRDNGFNPVQLHFNWNQPGNDAELLVPDLLKQLTHIPLQRYQDWDLVQITQNYLKFLLYYLRFGDGGILIHCISGWDRTPLFISLLRISLWADGRAHKSLGVSELLYFTLAYDWLIYGHQLKERHEKGEEIMYFCFDFLKYITSDEYSVNTPSRQTERSGLLEDSSGGNPANSGQSISTTYCNVDPVGSQWPDSSTELGESWVGVDASFVNPSPPGHQQQPLSLTGSWQKLSLDYRNETCLYSTSPPLQSEVDGSVKHTTKRGTQSDSQSLRVKRLKNMRELFIGVYRSSVPEVIEQPGGIFSGLLSRLAASVGT